MVLRRGRDGGPDCVATTRSVPVGFAATLLGCGGAVFDAFGQVYPVGNPAGRPVPPQATTPMPAVPVISETEARTQTTHVTGRLDYGYTGTSYAGTAAGFISWLGWSNPPVGCHYECIP